MSELFDLVSMGNFITALVTAIVTWGGTFLYHKQERERREIENESSQAEEWKKLFLESKEDSERKDRKIDELRTELNQVRNQMVRLERSFQLASIYGCRNLQCPVREALSFQDQSLNQNPELQ